MNFSLLPVLSCPLLHSYYKIMYNLAAKGDPRAQKEYAAWLRKLDKAKRAYQEAYDNEEIEQLAAYGYEVRQLILSYFIIGTITGR